jgi:hypothetical protein
MDITGKYWWVVLILCAASVGAVAAQQAWIEAPTGFDTPTLVENPGSQSVSNGIMEPDGDSFALDQQVYETTHDVNSGLGPVFNARACSDCHQNPVSGGASQFTELRVGHTDANGNFVNPTIPIDNGASSISGRSLVNDRAVVPEAQEHVPATENIRALRGALNTLGDGFVERSTTTRCWPLPPSKCKRPTARFTARLSRSPFWRPLDKIASAALAGRTSTALSFPSLAMPI